MIAKRSKDPANVVQMDLFSITMKIKQYKHIPKAIGMNSWNYKY